MRTLAFASAVLISACGGVDGSDLFNPVGGNDGGADGLSGNGDGSQGQDSASCNPTKCAVPMGFRFVNFAADRGKDCASGWKTTDVVSNPMVADPSACTCSCNVGTPPDCSKGQIHRHLDGDVSATCAYPATTFTASGGCDPIPGTGGLTVTYAHYSADPPAPAGGACSFDPKADASKVTATQGRVCEPPANCTTAVCQTPNPCVEQDGDVACPGDYPNKTLVGTAPNVDCGACGGTGSSCAVDATCTGTLSLYTDTGCSAGKLDFPVDSTCNAPSSSGANYNSFKFVGSVKTSTCAGPVPTSTPTAKVDGAVTVCCKKSG